MHNTDQLAMMKAKYIELGKKLGLNEELLKTITKELAIAPTPEVLKTPDEMPIPQIEKGEAECNKDENPLMIMLKKREY